MDIIMWKQSVIAPNNLKLGAKKLAVVCLINFSLAYYCFSQENSLFFLAAHPFYDGPDFPSYLFKLNNGGKILDTIQRFPAKNTSLREIKYYPYLREIIFVRDGFLNGNMSKSVEFLNMDTPDKLEGVALDSLNYMYINSWLFYSQSKARHFLGVDLYNSKISKKRTLLAVDINSLTTNEFNIDDLKQSEISGNAGTCLLSFDGLAAYTNSTTGELRIPETSDTISRPVFPIQLPKELQLHKKERRSIVLNYSKVFVFSLGNSPPSIDELGYSDLAILDKASSSWFRWRIKGNADYMIRGFNNWIAGTVCSENKIFDEKGRLKDKLNRVSPGKEQRRRKMTKTGMPADFRFEYFGVYSPGILYLLNTQTKKYIEWQTRQGDSEILLVENNEVYYRISDEIYKASIVNGKRLGEPKLLIKNEMVPDIHWAFTPKQESK